jgi:adenosylcobinamide-GDP ribazoletransferase
VADVARLPAAASRRPTPARELTAAIAFLTRIPVRVPAGSMPSTGAAAFGAVGLMLGIAASLPLVLAGPAHSLLAATGALAVLAALSGGLHLDGLGDTIDALAAGSARAEQARTDPRAGAAGVVAIVLVLVLEVAALGELAADGGLIAPAAVLAATVASRVAAPVWAVGPGARRTGTSGLGSWFSAETRPAAALVAIASGLLVLAVLVSAVGPRILLAAGAGALAAAVLGSLVIRARGQLDGDGYGFVIETTFAAILVAAALVG